jgi:HK97 family phage major capsid protein
MSAREQQPTYLANPPAALTSEQWLAKAAELTRSATFSKEDSSRFESYLALHQATRQDHFDREVFNTARQRRDASLRFDPATLAFFSGQKTYRDALASEGGRIETRRDQRVGAITELRSYVALNTSTTGEGGGFSIPIGFQGEVLQQMRQYDQLLDASRWIFTPTGNVWNFPAVDDTDTNIDAKVLAELGLITQGPNMHFGNGQFPNASTWVSPQFLYSIQLEQDGGPLLAAYFAEVFAKSFARGMGKTFLATLLSNLSAGETTASASVILMSEIYGLLDSIDTAYAAAPGAGFLMNWSTLLTIRQILTGTSGQLAFPHATDADGRPTILGKPVYLCANMDQVGAGNTVAVFGDLQRHAIRAVSDSFSTFRYDERYLPTHQRAVQAYWRCDSLLLQGSNTDAPMATLVMHA